MAYPGGGGEDWVRRLALQDPEAMAVTVALPASLPIKEYESTDLANSRDPGWDSQKSRRVAWLPLIHFAEVFSPIKKNLRASFAGQGMFRILVCCHTSRDNCTSSHFSLTTLATLSNVSYPHP